MTTKTDVEQERAEFEAWYQHHHGDRDVYVLDDYGEYADKRVQSAFNVWQARAALQSQEYTSAIGEAGQAYMDSFKYVHPLPVQFRWSELWKVMCAAANKGFPQSQVKNDTTLFCDLKTDEEKSAFFLSGRGYETGVIAQAIQNDVAMAYHRCAEYKKELEALQSQDRDEVELSKIGRAIYRACSDLPDGYEIRIDLEKGSGIVYVTDRDGNETMIESGNKLFSYQINEAIDHARRIES